MKFEWELINGGMYHGTQRAKVIGGWIVKENEIETEGVAIAMIFIPDAEHLWEIEKE